MRQEDEAAKRDSDIEQIVAFKKEQILNDEVLFMQLDEDYELDVHGQVLRVLRSLDMAVKQYNAIDALTDFDNSSNAYAIDAVFASLSNIQSNMISAIERQAKNEYNGRME